MSKLYVGQIFTRDFCGESSWDQLSEFCNTNGSTQENLSQDFTEGKRTLGKPGYKYEGCGLLRAILYKQDTYCREIKGATNFMAL